MIVREDRTYEINWRYPDTNWTDETDGVYVVDETTPEGQALAEKIMSLFPYFDLVVVDGQLVDVVENEELREEWEREQEIIDNDQEIVMITKEDLGLDRVDNTSDMEKPISWAVQAALDQKVDNSRVLTDVPANAVFTDTVTTINGKTGVITKEDIMALGFTEGTDYSAEIAELQDGMSGLQEEVAGLHEDVTGLRSDTDSLQGGIEILEGDLVGIQTNVSGLQTDVSSLQGTVATLQEDVTRIDSAKVDKVVGKGLSTEDYTTAEKQKLAGIEDRANNYTHPETHPASMIEGLARVAVTGDFNDLLNRPEEGSGGGRYNFLVGTDSPALDFIEEGMMYFQVQGEGFIEKMVPSKVTMSSQEPVLENLEEGELYLYYS